MLTTHQIFYSSSVAIYLTTKVITYSQYSYKYYLPIPYQKSHIAVTNLTFTEYYTKTHMLTTHQIFYLPLATIYLTTTVVTYSNYSYKYYLSLTKDHISLSLI